MKQDQPCCKCHAAPAAPGHRYCKVCKAAYMRDWRSTKVLVNREDAEKAGLTNDRNRYAGRTPIDKLPPLGG